MHVLALLLALGMPPDLGIAISSGVSAANLADTPTTSAINMEATKVTNQLALTLVVTPGTTTAVDVRCYESQDGTNFEQISLCDSATPKSSCHPDVREFTLSDFATVSGKKRITSRWSIKKPWAKCSVDDPDDGTGTVTVTGVRTWQ